MSDILDFMPRGPHWSLNWDAIDTAFPWVRALRGGQHSPVHHQEGDVWIHTRMVLEELVSSAEWQGMDQESQAITFAAALLHDVAKPQTAEVQPDGSVSNRGHSRKGAIMARQLLWEMGWPARLREHVCSLVSVHQVPFWLIDKDPLDALRFVARQSLTAANRLLACVAEADARGRVCSDKARITENVEFFREIARDAQCYTTPFPFADDATRWAYFARPNSEIDPRYSLPSPAHDGPEAILMSGLPAAGKSTWLRQNTPELPVVSMDHLRAKMKIAPDAKQGVVVQAARELARGYLRRREPFAWDGTNLSRATRGMLVQLFAEYGFRTRIVALEVGRDQLFQRNASRQAMVPVRVVESMFRKWEYPTPDECFAVECEAWESGSNHVAAPASHHAAGC